MNRSWDDVWEKSLSLSLIDGSTWGEDAAIGEWVGEGTIRSRVGSLGVEALRNQRRLEWRRFVSGVGFRSY